MQHPATRIETVSLARADPPVRRRHSSSNTSPDAANSDVPNAASSTRSPFRSTLPPPVSQAPRLHRSSSFMIDFQLAEFQQCRPYFLSWVILVQVVVLIVMLCTYPTAKWTFSHLSTSSSVASPDGTLIVVSKPVATNIFYGPSNADLVLLGAKYSPCMRTDRNVYEQVVAPSRGAEAAYGCCLMAAGLQCYNANQSDCGGVWVADHRCHDASCCQNPALYPTCSWLPAESLPLECSCDVIARPCCEGLLGDCSIQSPDYCNFVDGHYHANELLCSEVDCLNSLCGMGDFYHADRPDQWYRWIVSLFQSVGVVHFCVLVLAELALGWDLEKVIGWHRIAPVFFISGIGGYVISGSFTPYQVECGPSPAVFGLLACLVVELLQSWKDVDRHWWEALKLLLIIVIAFAVGLLPYVDNFAHIGGFLFGLASGLVFVPWKSYERWTRAKKKILTLLGLAAIVGMFVVAMPLFLTNQNPGCEWCEYADCVDFTAGFCESTGQRSPF